MALDPKDFALAKAAQGAQLRDLADPGTALGAVSAPKGPPPAPWTGLKHVIFDPQYAAALAVGASATFRYETLPDYYGIWAADAAPATPHVVIGTIVQNDSGGGTPIPLHGGWIKLPGRALNVTVTNTGAGTVNVSCVAVSGLDYQHGS